MNAPLNWAPSRAVFVRRAFINAAVTFAAFVLLAAITNYPQGQFLLLGIGLPFILTLILTLDDVLRWRRVRAESWEVDEGQLVHDGPDGRAMIPLAEIADVQKRWGSSVLVRLKSRQRVLMRYIEKPAEVAAALNTARST